MTRQPSATSCPCSGPATSATDEEGGPAATSARTCPTARAATGWILTCGTRTTGPNRVRLRTWTANSRNWAARTMVAATGPFLASLLLGHLGLAVAIAGDPVHPGDGQDDEMRDSPGRTGALQVTGHRGEERRGFGPAGGAAAGGVNNDLDAVERRSEALPCVQIDPGRPAEYHDVIAGSLCRRHHVRSDDAGPAGHGRCLTHS